MSRVNRGARVRRVLIQYTRTQATKSDEAKGAVAQLGERLLCKQEVVGSIPSSSTIKVVAAVVPIGCSLHSVQLWASARSPELKAVLFFNNSEGKGSSGLDESPDGHRVELYLVCALNKKAACGRRKHAVTVSRSRKLRGLTVMGSSD